MVNEEEQKKEEKQEKTYVQTVFDWPEEEDKFFSTNFLRFFIIPKGFKGVRTRLGRTDLGGEIQPGLRFVLGLYGLWGRVAKVDMRLKTEDLCAQNVITADNLELPEVDAIVNQYVSNPTLALTEAKNYNLTTMEIAEARVRSAIGSMTLEDISKIKDEGYNLALTNKLGGEYKAYTFKELEKIGIKMESVYLTQINFPDELRAALAQRASMRAEAEGELELATKRVDVAIRHKEAAQHYKDPEAQRLRDRDIADEAVKNNKNINIIGLGGIIETIGNIIGEKYKK